MLLSWFEFVTKSKVTDFNVTIFIKQNVLKFQISMHNSFRMHMTNSLDHLDRIKDSHFLTETHRMRSDFSARIG